MTPALCPDCRAPLASGATACHRCGLPLTGPSADELAATDAELAAINAEIAGLHGRWSQLAARGSALTVRRGELIGRLRATAVRPATAIRPADGTGQQAAAAARPAARAARSAAESSGYSVQAILLGLGGLLLAVAAVAFVAFAWGRFGIGGRAVVLAAVTGAVLAAPIPLIRRGLGATAETLALLGLVLLGLDGYAAWGVGLTGGLSAPVFAAAVTAVVTVAGAGYAPAVARHTAPGAYVLRWTRPAAVAAGQAVLPLLAAAVHLPWLPAGAVPALIAGANLAVASAARRRGARPELLISSIAGAWAAGAALLVTIAGLAADDPAGRIVPRTAILLVLAVLGLLAAEVARARNARRVAAAAAVLLTGAAAYRGYAIAGHGWWLTSAGVVALGLAACAARIPRPWRPGALTGAAIGAGLAALTPTLAIAGYLARGLAAPLGAWQSAPGTVFGGPGADVVAGFVLVVAAVTILLGRFAVPWWRSLAVVGAALGIVAAAAGLPLAWALAAELAVIAALAGARRFSLAPKTAAELAAGVLSVHAALFSLASRGTTLAVLGILAAGWAVVVLTQIRQTPGGLAAAVAFAALCAEAGAVTAALGGSRLSIGLAVIAVAATAGLARRIPAIAVPVQVTGAVAAYAGLAVTAWHTDRATFGAVAALAAVALAAGGLRNAFAGAAGIAGLATAVPLAATVFGPLGWIAEIWHGAPAAATTAGPSLGWPGSPLDLVTLTLLGLGAAAVARGRGYPVALAATPFGIASLVLAAPAAGAPWGVGLAATTALAVAGAGLAATAGPHRYTGSVTVGLLGPAALAGSLAAPASTLAVLAATLAVGALIAWQGRTEPARTTAAGSAGLAALALGYAGLAAAGAARPDSALGLLAAASILGAVAQRIPAPSARILACLGASGGVAAVVLTAGSARHTALALTLGGAVLAMLALRSHRRALGWSAAAAELAGSWAWLHSAGVRIPEAYTLPAALVASAAGLWVLVRDPARGSWAVLGAPLAAALLPSLALTFTAGSPGLRALALGAAALALTLAGALTRRQAPFVLGSVTLALVAIRQVWPFLPLVAEAVPAWVPLTAGGVLLVAAGATYERRLRDLRRVRVAVGQMR